MDNIIKELRYWQSEEGPDPEIWARSQHNKFITFEIDRAGLNNIRMAFEVVYSFAAFTGRTLVLPPAEPWYLANYDYSLKSKLINRTHISDVFDFNAASELVPLISTEDFIEIIKSDFAVPKCVQQEITNVEAIEKENFKVGQASLWYQYLRSNAQIPKWNPQTTLYCHPDIKRVQSSGFGPISSFVDQRHLVEYDKDKQDALILHFPSNHESGVRSFGQAVNMVSFAYPEQARFHARLIKRGIRYTPLIFSIASKVISFFGLYDYDALHIRGNDFASQFKSAVNQTPKEFTNSLNQILRQEHPLYISTDESNSIHLECLGEGRKIITWNSLLNDHSGQFNFIKGLPEAMTGPIEQIICAAANTFVGTKFSTFSLYIHRLRCFINAPDLNIYFHTHDDPQKRPDRSQIRRGRDWSDEYTEVWTRC